MIECWNDWTIEWLIKIPGDWLSIDIRSDNHNDQDVVSWYWYWWIICNMMMLDVLVELGVRTTNLSSQGSRVDQWKRWTQRKECSYPATQTKQLQALRSKTCGTSPFTLRLVYIYINTYSYTCNNYVYIYTHKSSQQNLMFSQHVFVGSK